MAIYVVSYELRAPGKDYAALYAHLKTFVHCHHQTSTWFIDTTLSTEQVRVGVATHIDSNDTCFVGHLMRDWSSWNMPCAPWLNDPARRWKANPV